jgi:hypothetical protein
MSDIVARVIVGQIAFAVGWPIMCPSGHHSPLSAPLIGLAMKRLHNKRPGTAQKSAI